MRCKHDIEAFQCINCFEKYCEHNQYKQKCEYCRRRCKHNKQLFTCFECNKHAQAFRLKNMK